MGIHSKNSNSDPTLRYDLKYYIQLLILVMGSLSDISSNK